MGTSDNLDNVQEEADPNVQHEKMTKRVMEMMENAGDVGDMNEEDEDDDFIRNTNFESVLKSQSGTIQSHAINSQEDDLFNSLLNKNM